MNELLQIPLLPLLLTLGAYQIGLTLQRKTGSALFNPVLIGFFLVLAFLFVTGMPHETFQTGAALTSWLLTPATISLAIPMYEHFNTLRKNLRAIFAGVACGAVSSLFLVLVLCLAAGFDRTLTVSLLPKSITTAFGVPISELYGGIGAITTVAIIITGMISNLLGPLLCRVFRLTSPIARGAAFGTAGHVIGTAKACEYSPLTGAVSSLSLVTAGLLTSVVFPLIIKLL